MTILNKIADVSVIGICVAVGVTFFVNRAEERRPGARVDVLPRETVYEEQRNPAGRATLVLYLSADCRFCTDSMEFYRRLQTAAARSRTTDIAFQARAGEREFLAYLAAHGFTEPAIVNRPVPPAVRGTPTLILFDANGAVAGSWAGRLSADQESELMRRVVNGTS